MKSERDKKKIENKLNGENWIRQTNGSGQNWRKER